MIGFEERVVLVDEHDRALGSAGKLEAHLSGDLHRAVSVLLFNGRGEILLQRRAAEKYHSAGLWSNTCCGHPRPGEGTEAAARRRLQEEMGIDCPITRAFGFRYRAALGDGLSEHEYDHVFIGRFDGDPNPDPAEVGDWRWVGFDSVRRDIARAADRYTHWFPLVLDRLAAGGGAGAESHRDGGAAASVLATLGTR